MSRGVVVVTGSVSGIGRATAERLAAAGFDVIPVMRRDEPLPPPVQPPVLLDFAQPDSIEPACEQLLERAGGRIAALVNNAGTTVSGPFEAIPLADWRWQFEVNFFGHLAVTRALLPALLAARGRIVNVGSVGGRMSVPFLSPYGASKAAIHAWSDALRLELAPHGVHVALVEPGAVATPIWQKGNASADDRTEQLSDEQRQRYGRQLEGARRAARTAERHAVPVERCAAVVADAVTARKPHGRYLVGPDARLQAAVAVLPSPLFDAVTGRLLGSRRR